MRREICCAKVAEGAIVSRALSKEASGDESMASSSVCWRLALGVALAVASSVAAWADDTIASAGRLQLAQTSSESQRSEPAPGASGPQRFAIALGGLYTHREAETAGWAPNLAVNYAATDRLELHFMAPYAFDHVTGGATHFGIGDVEIGARFRFVDENLQSWEPAVSVYPLVDFPTGSARQNLGTGSTHAFLPLWFSKSFGDWTPYGGGGYWINPGTMNGTKNKDWVFASVGVLNHISDMLTLGGEIFHATSSKSGLKEQTGFNIVGRASASVNHHMIFSIGRGLQNASQTNEVTVYAAYLLTF
jgi:hypothetical protein